MDVTPQRYFTIGAVNAPQNGISAVVHHPRDLVYVINKWLQKKRIATLGNKIEEIVHLLDHLVIASRL